MAVARGGLRGLEPHPVFGRTVNPISIRGADYAHHSTTSPPGFSDLATALWGIYARFAKKIAESL